MRNKLATVFTSAAARFQPTRRAPLATRNTRVVNNTMAVAINTITVPATMAVPVNTITVPAVTANTLSSNIKARAMSIS